MKKRFLITTGLLDPYVEVRGTHNQIEDLIHEIKLRRDRDERVLVTTLTKRMAEDLSERLIQAGIRARYMHSEIETLKRNQLIRQLRLGEFDCIVGINLLREGLDIPEVSLVAILDADKEGFLRNETSLIQTIGRAARNVNGTAIMYAEKKTPAILAAVLETNRRRRVQEEYNKKNNIVPRSIVKDIPVQITIEFEEKERRVSRAEIKRQIIILEEKMNEAAERLDFEEAIDLRDKITELKRKMARM
ncbi:MAG: helicase-related protein [Candidatus Anstonellales archaeon]